MILAILHSVVWSGFKPIYHFEKGELGRGKPGKRNAICVNHSPGKCTEQWEKNYPGKSSMVQILNNYARGVESIGIKSEISTTRRILWKLK